MVPSHLRMTSHPAARVGQAMRSSGCRLYCFTDRSCLRTSAVLFGASGPLAGKRPAPRCTVNFMTVVLKSLHLFQQIRFRNAEEASANWPTIPRLPDPWMPSRLARQDFQTTTQNSSTGAEDSRASTNCKLRRSPPRTLQKRDRHLIHYPPLKHNQNLISTHNVDRRTRNVLRRPHPRG